MWGGGRGGLDVGKKYGGVKQWRSTTVPKLKMCSTVPKIADI